MAEPPPQASLFDDPQPAPRSSGAAEPPPSAAPSPPQATGKGGYSAKDIEVLEGLEPVRMRPGMYIGGTDERALHHLFAEVLDNAMDEAVAGHARIIEVRLGADGALTVRDDGRGIPVDPHPKHPGKSALEVIMTVLHSGGKFSGKAYETSGGLHGVGVSVVNALSEHLEVTAFKDGFEWRQAFSRGHVLAPIQQVGPSKKRGTLIRFKPDEQIFGVGDMLVDLRADDEIVLTARAAIGALDEVGARHENARTLHAVVVVVDAPQPGVREMAADLSQQTTASKPHIEDREILGPPEDRDRVGQMLFADQIVAEGHQPDDRRLVVVMPVDLLEGVGDLAILDLVPGRLAGHASSLVMRHRGKRSSAPQPGKIPGWALTQAA